MKNKYVGSSFDDFLKEEELLVETEATAAKRVLAYQIQKEMTAQHISKSDLARRMHSSRSSLDRLLDPENPSVTLLTLENIAIALGKRLKIQIG